MKHFGLHAPAEQTCPVPHAAPSESGTHVDADVSGAHCSHAFAGFKAPAANRWPSIRQTETQTPDSQASVAVQAWSHPPQCAGSLSVLTQVSPHCVVPASVHISGTEPSGTEASGTEASGVPPGVEESSLQAAKQPSTTTQESAMERMEIMKVGDFPPALRISGSSRPGYSQGGVRVRAPS